MQKPGIISDTEKLLIITAGGSPEPVYKSIGYWRPKRVLFICSKQSAEKLQKNLEKKADPARDDSGRGEKRVQPGAGSEDSAGRFSEKAFKETAQKVFPFLERHNISFLTVDDHENISKTFEDIKAGAEPEHKNWIKNGESYQSIADITGGTKCMSASLALAAHKWERCVFSYVGGERDKRGLGAVKSGFEKIVQSLNPWEALGFQSMEEAVLLFREHSYSAAYQVLKKAFGGLKSARTGAKTETLRQEFFAAQAWAKAYQMWDDFQHRRALFGGAAEGGRSEAPGLEKLSRKHVSNLKIAFKGFDEIDIEKSLFESVEYLKKIIGPAGGEIKNSPYLIFDLTVNAWRKAAQGRFDDAAARLYRAIEAMAQLRLQEKHNLESKNISYNALTPSLKKKHKDSKTVKLGLQGCYLFLMERDDLLGKKFKELGLMAEDKEFEGLPSAAGKKPSSLTVRNSSILAHGFKPLSKGDYESLLRSARGLFEILTDDISGAGDGGERGSGLEILKENLNFDEIGNKLPYFPGLKIR